LRRGERQPNRGGFKKKHLREYFLFNTGRRRINLKTTRSLQKDRKRVHENRQEKAKVKKTPKTRNGTTLRRKRSPPSNLSKWQRLIIISGRQQPCRKKKDWGKTRTPRGCPPGKPTRRKPPENGEKPVFFRRKSAPAGTDEAHSKKKYFLHGRNTPTSEQVAGTGLTQIRNRNRTEMKKDGDGKQYTIGMTPLNRNRH